MNQMNYAITEDEYNAIDAARSQLNLVAGLLTSTDADRNLFDASDLYYFLAAQTATLKGVLNSADDRRKAERDKNNVLSCIDWMTIIRVVSGRRALTGTGLKDMSRKLQNCVKVDPDMEYVLNAWTEVMTDGGNLPFDLSPNSTDGFLIGFEERVPVVAPPATAPTVTAKKPVARKRR